MKKTLMSVLILTCIIMAATSTIFAADDWCVQSVRPIMDGKRCIGYVMTEYSNELDDIRVTEVLYNAQQEQP